VVHKDPEERKKYHRGWSAKNKVKIIQYREDFKNKDQLFYKKIKLEQYYKHRNKILKNQKIRITKKRQEAMELLGEVCNLCKNIENRMEFHHLVYVDDSRTCRIELEVLSHPERFQLLCWICHRLITFGQKYPERVECVLNYLKDTCSK